MADCTIQTYAGGSSSGGGTVSGFTPGSVIFASASGTLTEDNPNFFWDDTNNLLGLGLLVPQARLHLDGAAAAVYGKFTNTATGATASDGFDIGIDASGNAEVRQRENLDLGFFANNTEYMRISNTGKIYVGDPTGATIPLFLDLGGNISLVASKTLTDINSIIAIGGNMSVITVDPVADTSTGFFTAAAYASTGGTIYAVGNKNYTGFPLGALAVQVSVLGMFGAGTVNTTGGTLDAMSGLFFDTLHGGYGGAVTDTLYGAIIGAGTGDDAAIGVVSGTCNRAVGILVGAAASGVNLTTGVSAWIKEPLAFDALTGAGIPTITNQTAAWIDGTISVTESAIASAASITNMDVLTSLIMLSGSTATTIHGIHADDFNKEIKIVNTSGQPLSFAHQSGTEGTARNRIITRTGLTVIVAANATANLNYLNSQQRWYLEN